MCYVSYELRALVGGSTASVAAARLAGVRPAQLTNGYGLVPITDEAFDRLGDEGPMPFGEVFCFLSAAIESLARQASAQGEIAYLEADIFGGIGSQVMVVWGAGQVSAGPVTTTFGWPPPDPSSSPDWAFNQALRHLGVERSDSFDEFDALGLGRYRNTDDWAAGLT